MSTTTPRWLHRLGCRAAAHLVEVGGSLGSVLLPSTCCLCGFSGMRPGVDLCAYCAQLLPRTTRAGFECPSLFSRALVPYRYAYPIDRFIRRLKFRGDRPYARVLGTLLAQAHLESGAPLPQELIPIPLHATRYCSRGFNQAAEIARFAAAELGTQVDDRCLTRVIATREQSGLSLEERSRNVREAFRVRRPPSVRHVALVDDVLTTGNTVGEAARVLAAMPLESIELWAVAHVPSRSPG